MKRKRAAILSPVLLLILWAQPPSAAAQASQPSLAFVPADASVVIRADMSALRRSIIWFGLQPQIQQLVAAVPACKMSMVYAISKLAFATRARPAPSSSDWGVKVVGKLPRAKVTACLSGLAVLFKEFRVHKLANGFRIVSNSGSTLAAAKWTSYGLWLSSGSLSGTRGRSTQIHALLGKFHANSSFSWASITPKNMRSKPTKQGTERARQLWFELQHGAKIDLRGGLRYSGNAAARKSISGIIQAFADVATKRGLKLDATAIRKHFRFRVRRGWLLWNGSLTERELLQAVKHLNKQANKPSP